MSEIGPEEVKRIAEATVRYNQAAARFEKILALVGATAVSVMIAGGKDEQFCAVLMSAVGEANRLAAACDAAIDTVSEAIPAEFKETVAS